MWSARKLPMRPERVREVEGANSMECAAGLGIIVVLTTSRRGRGDGLLKVGAGPLGIWVGLFMTTLPSVVRLSVSIKLSPIVEAAVVVDLFVSSSSFGISLASIPES